jgi:small subunit ribosomal protein S16
MVTIRLSRSGAKKKPFFHITVTDSRKPRDGRFIERIGYFNPIAKGKELRLKVDHERIDYWLGVGASLSDKVALLVKQSKFTPEEQENYFKFKEEKRLKILSKKKEKAFKEATPEAEAEAEATPEAEAEAAPEPEAEATPEAEAEATPEPEAEATPEAEAEEVKQTSEEGEEKKD